MNPYDDTIFHLHLYPAAWYAWPQSFVVPRGFDYRTGDSTDFQRAEQDITVDLYCAGDWLEMVDPDNPAAGDRYQLR